MDRNDLRSQSLDLLRFPLAVIVLVIHVFGSGGFTVQGNPVSLEGMPITMEVNRFIDGFLRGQSVPIYYFISGFVFFLGVKLDWGIYKKKLKNRMSSLLVPYLIWNLIAVLKSLIVLLLCFSSLYPNANKAQLDLSLLAILETFWDASKGMFDIAATTATAASTYPINFPLWFVRDLMIVVLCAPVLYGLLKRARHYFVWLLGISWFALSYWDFGHVNQLLTAFFFFSWGAYMSVNQKDMLQVFSRFIKPSMLLYPLLALLYVFSAHCFPDFSATIKKLNIIAGLFFAYNASSWLLAHSVCKASRFLSSSSFFIYVSHSLICGECLKLLYLIIRPANDLELLSIFVLAVFSTVTMLLLIFCLLRRYTPMLLKVITGRK